MSKSGILLYPAVAEKALKPMKLFHSPMGVPVERGVYRNWPEPQLASRPAWKIYCSQLLDWPMSEKPSKSYPAARLTWPVFQRYYVEKCYKLRQLYRSLAKDGYAWWFTSNRDGQAGVDLKTTVCGRLEGLFDCTPGGLVDYDYGLAMARLKASIPHRKFRYCGSPKLCPHCHARRVVVPGLRHLTVALHGEVNWLHASKSLDRLVPAGGSVRQFLADVRRHVSKFNDSLTRWRKADNESFVRSVTTVSFAPSLEGFPLKATMHCFVACQGDPAVVEKRFRRHADEVVVLGSYRKSLVGRRFVRATAHPLLGIWPLYPKHRKTPGLYLALCSLRESRDYNWTWQLGERIPTRKEREAEAAADGEPIDPEIAASQPVENQKFPDDPPKAVSPWEDHADPHDPRDDLIWEAYEAFFDSQDEPEEYESDPDEKG